MADWYAHVSQFTVFLALSAAGFLFLLVALFFGEIFEHLDGSADHDCGHGGPSFFSVRIISVFITAFGGFGAVATHYGFGVLGSSGVGFLSGATFAGLIYAFASFLYGQQASTDIHPRDVVGQIGARRRSDPEGRRGPGPLPGRRAAARQDRAHEGRQCPSPRMRSSPSPTSSAKP